MCNWKRASDSHSFCWKLISNIFCGLITLEQRWGGCLFTGVCTSVCTHVYVWICLCECVHVVLTSLAALLAFPVSLALVQTNTQRLILSLLVPNTHTHTHSIFKVLELPAAITLHSWSHVSHWWPQHWAWLKLNSGMFMLLGESARTAVHLSILLTPVWAYQEERSDTSMSLISQW